VRIVSIATTGCVETKSERYEESSQPVLKIILLCVLSSCLLAKAKTLYTFLFSYENDDNNDDDNGTNRAVVYLLVCSCGILCTNSFPSKSAVAQTLLFSWTNEEQKHRTPSILFAICASQLCSMEHHSKKLSW